MIPKLRRALLLLLLPPLAAWSQEDTWTGVERVVAVGDIHGDYDQLVAVLKSASLIDDQLQWSGGKTHLVQTGDVTDRGPESRKAMDLLMRLEGEALKSGGAVHALMGNHEAMNVYGDLRYVSDGEYLAFADANSVKARDELYKEHLESLKGQPVDDAFRKRWEGEHPLGFAEHRRAFGPAGVYGKWIRGLNAVIRIDGTLFLHGGISPKYADWNLRLLNQRIRADLEDPRNVQEGVAGDDAGPLWYRGLALSDARIEAQLGKVLENYKVDRIVVGHTYTEGAILPRLGGRVIQIDVAMSKVYDPKGRIACLEIDRGKARALHRGKRLELPADAGPDLLRYLKEAAALDPAPSPLAGRIAALEARLPRK